MTEPIDRGLQEELDRQKAEEAASIGTPNWAGSNKLVADAAFVRNGVLYFAYELSSLFDGQPTWVVYEASGVNPNQYKGNWGADGAGNQRVGPRIGTEPDGLLIEGGNFELFTLGAGDPARGIDALSDDVDLIDLVDEGYRTLVDNYGFFFDEVNGEFPGMELLFSRLGQGLPVTVQDLQSAGIGANVSQLKLDYLNATIASRDSDNPFVYTVNGEEVVNQKYVDHYGKVEGLAEGALEELGFDAALFQKENKLFYKQLVNTLVKGNISSTMMTEFIGYVLGVEGYETPDDDALTNLFSSVAKSVKSEQFSTSNTLFANALDAESLAIRKIGIGNYNALSEDKKREIMLMYNDSVDAATNMLQAMFEEYYPEYAGKNLDYASVKGKYLNKWQGIFGEAPDEEDSNWSDQIGKPVAEASKAYMTHAYNTGNPFFNRSIATSINQSLGGVVIR